MDSSQEQDKYFLRAVTELSDTRHIVANCDIFSHNGMKLVASGIRITSDLYDHLVNHRLQHRLETVLTVEDALEKKVILQDVLDLIKTNAKLQGLADAISEGRPLSRIISAIHLPTPLSFKLTVAREKYDRIYRHSLLLLVVAVYLAHRDAMNSQELEWVPTAALCQDIGLLHIDPKLLVPTHTMSADERRNLYTHPVTAHLMLCEFPALSRNIADAVLEHHERMDGSGYPRGLRGRKISRYGQILAVAELVAKAFSAENSKVDPWKKLEVMLKLNSRRYGKGLIGYVDFCRSDLATIEGAESPDADKLGEQVRLISKLFNDVDSHSGSKSCDEIYDIVHARLDALRIELLDAGFDPRDPERLLKFFADDPGCVADYALLLSETLWRFEALVKEISRLRLKAVERNDRRPEVSEQTWWIDLQRSLKSAAQYEASLLSSSTEA